jgi:hypothetical protein
MEYIRLRTNVNSPPCAVCCNNSFRMILTKVYPDGSATHLIPDTVKANRLRAGHEGGDGHLLLIVAMRRKAVDSLRLYN